MLSRTDVVINGVTMATGHLTLIGSFWLWEQDWLRLGASGDPNSAGQMLLCLRSSERFYGSVYLSVICDCMQTRPLMFSRYTINIKHKKNPGNLKTDQNWSHAGIMGKKMCLNCLISQQGKHLKSTAQQTFLCSGQTHDSQRAEGRLGRRRIIPESYKTKKWSSHTMEI